MLKHACTSTAIQEKIEPTIHVQICEVVYRHSRDDVQIFNTVFMHIRHMTCLSAVGLAAAELAARMMQLAALEVW